LGRTYKYHLKLRTSYVSASSLARRGEAWRRRVSKGRTNALMEPRME